MKDQDKLRDQIDKLGKWLVKSDCSVSDREIFVDKILNTVYQEIMEKIERVYPPNTPIGLDYSDDCRKTIVKIINSIFSKS